MGNSQKYHHPAASTKNIKTAFFLNLFFTIVEIVGGLLTNSLAIISDAVHDLGDSVSLGLAWYLQNYSKKRRDSKYTYGYKRFSVLGAFITALVLLVGSIFIIREAIPRLLNPEAVEPKGMIAIAILGVVVNGAAMLNLKKGQSLNERVLSLHFLEDVLGWVAVLIVSIILLFKDWPVLDPILSLAISAYILYNVIKSLIKVFRVLLQRVPDSVKLDELEKAILEIDGVSGLHDLHVWTIDSEYNILTLHVVTDHASNEETSVHLKENIRQKLKQRGIHHATIEVEDKDHVCEMSLEHE